VRSHFWHIPGVANISTGSHTIQTTYGDVLKKLGQGGIDPPVSLKSDKSSSVITSLVRLRGGATGTVRGGATGTARGGGIGTALGGGTGTVTGMGNSSGIGTPVYYTKHALHTRCCIKYECMHTKKTGQARYYMLEGGR